MDNTETSMQMNAGGSDAEQSTPGFEAKKNNGAPTPSSQPAQAQGVSGPTSGSASDTHVNVPTNAKTSAPFGLNMSSKRKFGEQGGTDPTSTPHNDRSEQADHAQEGDTGTSLPAPWEEGASPGSFGRRSRSIGGFTAEFATKKPPIATFESVWKRTTRASDGAVKPRCQNGSHNEKGEGGEFVCVLRMQNLETFR